VSWSDDSKSEEESTAKEEEEDLSNFLYAPLGKDADPVVEYRIAENMKPTFLYNGTGHPARIVEFYAPWCPHVSTEGREARVEVLLRRASVCRLMGGSAIRSVLLNHSTRLGID
jgi:hypothetical protein